MGQSTFRMLLAHVLPLLSAWARAHISWDPWTNFTNFSDAGVLSGTCGTTKCYFPVSTLASPGPSGGNGAATGERGAQGQAMGWLIQPQSRHAYKPRVAYTAGEHPELSVWMKTWDFAEDLHTRYGANHLLLGPPRRIALGRRDGALLNAHLLLFVALFPRFSRARNVSTRYHEGNVLVQPVRSCPPSSCLLMGCQEGKARAFARELPAFLEHVHDKEKFIRALERNVRSVNAMVRVTTCLHRDFQAFVRNDGQIFHLDLDRCFPPVASLTWKDDCLDNALAAINTEISKGENRSD